MKKEMSEGLILITEGPLKGWSLVLPDNDVNNRPRKINRPNTFEYNKHMCKLDEIKRIRKKRGMSKKMMDDLEKIEEW